MEIKMERNVSMSDYAACNDRACELTKGCTDMRDLCCSKNAR